MSSLCRVCLVGNVKMYPIGSTNTQKIYESVTNTKLSTVQGPQTVCYLCHCLLHKYGKFSEQARNSEYILKDLYNKGIEATSENIAKTSHVLQINFSTSCVETMDVKDIKKTTNTNHLSNNGAAHKTVKENTDTTRFEAVMIFNEEVHIKEEIDAFTEVTNEEAMDFQSHDNYIEIPPFETTEYIKQGDGLHAICDTCGEILSNKDQLVLHIRKYHNPEKSSKNDTKSFLCTHCKRQFPRKSYLEKHMVVHNEKSKIVRSFVPPKMSESDFEKDLTADFNIVDETEEKNGMAAKSKHRYIQCYNSFMKWHTERAFECFTENVVMTYFRELSVNLKPTTLWNIYSMLKTTLSIKHDVNMKDFDELLMFLREQSNGYTTRKAKVFTAAEIQLFLNEAPDERYLAVKVVMIIALSGACRVTELINLTVQNLERQGELIVVKLKGIKKKYNRTFVVRKEYVALIEKYIQLRPRDLKTNRFFVSYQKGKCVRSVIGKNNISAMPKLIATYLNLPNPHLYSGRCFQCSAVL